VVVATPVATHYPFVKAALQAGKHVLVEKPFTTSMSEAEELIRLAETNRLTLMVDHTFVYTGAVRKIKEIVESGEFGDLLYFNWLAPVKLRRALIAGSRKMIVYDDIEPTEKVRVYDKGVTTNRIERDEDKEAAYRTLVSYRTGDVWVPKLDSTEALAHVCAEF